MDYDWGFMARCIVIPIIGMLLTYPFIRRKYPD